MNRVEFQENVIIYLNELIDILIDKEYFGFEKSAIEYVSDLLNDIEQNIDKKHKKDAPEYFSKYEKGLQYVTYRRSKNTQWYVFFTLKTRCIMYITLEIIILVLSICNFGR